MPILCVSLIGKTGQNTLLKHAEKFLPDLAGERLEEDQIEPERPIIFVAWSQFGRPSHQAGSDHGAGA